MKFLKKAVDLCRYSLYAISTMKKTKQMSLYSSIAYNFHKELNEYLTLGWRVVPTTLVVCAAATTLTWCVVVEKEID